MSEMWKISFVTRSGNAQTFDFTPHKSHFNSVLMSEQKTLKINKRKLNCAIFKLNKWKQQNLHSPERHSWGSNCFGQARWEVPWYRSADAVGLMVRQTSSSGSFASSSTCLMSPCVAGSLCRQSFDRFSSELSRRYHRRSFIDFYEWQLLSSVDEKRRTQCGLESIRENANQ